ncbi:hypothetical protein N3K66_007237 [Trichothecium roseum]|uniref:Uncharacterized protein n=1 Tax=Trichothecium roseum TaxID=47278 RepID=A0ACC0UTF4_9HYPO|nr:hypothetical protein N3K66_007237 [Trichothecium roseum]
MYKAAALVLSALLKAGHGASLASEARAFTLYAYGEGIGGLPIFAQGNLAYIGNPSGLNASDVAPIQFLSNTDDTAWTVSPNDTVESPPFTQATFYIPTASAASRQAGFVPDDDEDNADAEDGKQLDGFLLYGNFAFHRGDGGKMETLWYALPAADASDVWSLNWNSTGDDDDDAGRTVLTLKTNPPSNGSHPHPGDDEE